ncbi:MAG: sodium:alanine symporter family protein [Coriobacteriales bacterium]|jgi:AGCS family alanine or glycine:cation symporter|nr:sodium:alanine symporter family protein [Coriobacteriales bacterium]
MEIVDAVAGFFKEVNGYLWGIPMLVLLMGTHLFITIRTGFIQRKLFKGIKLSFQADSGTKGDISQFGALATALAPTIGTGNIIGVGTAIAMGGPGAVLWMWLTGVFGIATKYAESYISVKYRVQTESGTMLGGAMYALERGLKQKWLAVLFALFTAIAAFGIGSMVQSNAVSTAVVEYTAVPPWVVGAVLVVLVGIVTIGGIKFISRVCTKVVPVMAVLYVLGCLVILVMNAQYLWDAVVIICQSAFSPSSAFGGFIGSTIAIAAHYGVARGVFSNESGMGSAPIAAAAARTKNPARQALVSMTGTFWDTVIICLMTGLVLVTTIIANPQLNEVFLSGKGDLLTKTAFGQIPVVGVPLLIFGLLTFAYTTIIGWSYYGDRAITYLFGKKMLLPYRLIFIVTVFLGAVVGSIDLVWEMADTFNALMAIPNLIAVLALSGLVWRETKHFVYQDNLDEAADQDIPIVAGK